MYAAAARHRRLRLFVFLSLAAILVFNLIGSRNIVTGSLTSRLPVLSSRKWPASSHDGSSKTLVVYAYFEDSHDIGFQNANFFVKHALHASADFIFILQGDAPKFRPTIPDERNIRIIQRDNTCMDLGAYGELFRSENGLATRYRKYIFINASVRGPFIPMWSHICWSDAFTSRLSDSVKLVSMSGHCLFDIFQMQSMAFATDSLGLSAFLAEDTFACANDHQGAIDHEVHMAEKLWTKYGWESYGLLTALHGDPSYEGGRDCKATSETYDHMYDNGYFGFNVHPYETMFMKTNRKINPEMIRKFTSWFDRMNYSSYDHC